MNIGNRPQLPLTSSGCSCCGPSAAAHAAAAHGSGTALAPVAAGAPSDGGTSSQRSFAVEGMTCGHCVRSVEAAVSALDGVTSASVGLVPGGLSRLTVEGPAPDAAIREAVTAAGYALA
ncbi:MULTISPECIES: heavy-metal-associated domain-containing protein [unclassified Arthrobacter]|uniref:heavy-metal-associated domain-containing protein n=1 Tax=unclassified Arthrobacter TaxID=235627 RepID=UPI001C8438AD|nr:heavy-metal-associated domain-containing protein [Arthrobacter sp. MAHUQ-56]MBX7444827.1 heavy-metal-associated domain-containing protein [Arthrobacter sp. MAHUQ-56]